MSDLQKKISDLTPEKRALLELLLEEEGVEVESTIILPQERVWNEELGGYIMPLSYAQQRLWFLDQFSPNTALYNLPSAFRLKGRMDVGIFKTSIREIITRHESLRTNFLAEDGEPFQIIKPEIEFNLNIIDISELSEDLQEERIKDFIEKDAREPFNLTDDVLFRVTLIRLDDNDHVLMATMHHIISDGWSMGVLIREIVQVYQASINGQKPQLQELPIQYGDFAAWQRNWLKGQVLNEQLNYWKKQLGSVHPILGLPTDRPRPAVRSGKGGSYFFELSSEISTSIRDLSQKEEATLFVTLLTAFAALLYRYTQQDEIRIGTPIAGRNRREIEGLIGFFVNTLVMQALFDEDTTFHELLAQVKDVSIGAYSHQDIPFEMLVDELQPERDMSVPPLFQVMFSLQNAPTEAWELPGLTVQNLPVHTGTAKFDLSLILYEKVAEKSQYILGGTLEYDADLFEEASIVRLVEHLQVLLGGITSNPNLPISELSLLDEKEQRKVLFDWSVNLGSNDADKEYRLKCIHQIFETQVEKTPDEVAVVYQDQQITFDELNRRSNKLAYYLREIGIKPDNLVGLSVDRSIDLVVGLMGILKAGGAYLPLDPAYPVDRLAYMLKDSHASVLITQRKVLDRLLDEQIKGKDLTDIICIDTDWDDLIADKRQNNPENKTSPNNLAYVIYTSGSTGLPKGVLIEHHSAINLMLGLKRMIYENHPYELKPTDERKNLRLSLNAPLSFDASVQQWIMMLLGHTIYIVPQEVRLDGDALRDFICDNKLDVVDCVPSQLKLLVEVGLLNRMDSLPQAILPGGESIDVETWNILSHTPDIQFYNMYGPTECAVDSTISHINSRNGKPVIGRPNMNVRHYILDRRMNPVPVGVPGELYIGGEGVGRGYLDRAPLTAERFLPNPFAELAVGSGESIEQIFPPVDRLYKTGDLVRYLSDGQIEYLGRTDFQVKIRGFRIELGEIENVLIQHDLILSAIVMAREDTPGVQQLVAYVVPEETGDDVKEEVHIIESRQTKELIPELHGYLKERLPDYMVPTVFVVLNRFPLTPSGKVNRRELPAPNRESIQRDQEFVAPRTPEEKILAGIWKQVLGLTQISVHDNFFKLGGHSLLATQVVSRTRKVFDLDIPLRFIFDLPTIEEFADAIKRLKLKANKLQQLSFTRIPRDGDLPLSFGQQRLWFLDQLEPDSPVYNIPDAIKVNGHLSVQALQESLNYIVQRHEVLRTTFQTMDGKPVLIIEPVLRYEIPIIDLSAVPEREKQHEVHNIIVEESRKPFDLAVSPLFRVSLLKMNDEEWVILFTLHHIISDGWSSGVLINEIAHLYPAIASGVDMSELAQLLPNLDIQYVDYAKWQREWLSGETLERYLDYWKKQLDDAPPLLELPTDLPRPAIQSSRGDHERFEISDELGQALRDLSQKENVTLFMLLLAAFQALLFRYTHQESILVGTPIANRNRPEIEKLIGFFVNTLVLRANFSEDLSFEDLLQQVREVSLDAYAHQELPFEMLVDVVQPERDLSHTPLFQVMFMLQNTAKEKIQLPGLNMERMEVNPGIAMFDITLVISEAGEKLFGGIEYNTDLFYKSTIRRMFSHYVKLLEAIVEKPSQQIRQIPLLSDTEREKVVYSWNETDKNYPQNICLHELFEAQVERTPEAIAVISSKGQITYQELNQKVNQLAHYLHNFGIRPGGKVGVAINRSIEMIVALLAVLKSGAAYIPLDPSYPQERLTYIIKDSSPAIILTNASIKKNLQTYGEKILALDTEWGEISNMSAENLPDSRVATNDLAYIIYTSGSTGEPKGVMVEHHSVVNHNLFCVDAFRLTSDDRVLQFATMNFDTAVEEIFPTLLSGATLVLRNDEVLLSGNELTELIDKYELTVLDLPTAYWHEWVYELALMGKRVPESVKLVIVGGEKCLKERYENWLQVVGENCSWMNTYGPTEATIVASYYESDTDQLKTLPDIPIGRPIANVKLYILDDLLSPVPIGVSGELCIAGAGVARGYHNDSQKTAEHFVPDPYSGVPGARMYRTGDLVRFLPDGNIAFIGRVDQQVKVRGFRVELGEIDAVSIKHPDVREAITVTSKSSGDHLRLVAYLVPARHLDEEEVGKFKKDVRQYLKDVLPDYMIPSTLIVLDELPKLPNGKINRRGLPEPEVGKDEGKRDFIAPRNEREEILAKVWSNVLGLDEIGIHDNFFELGGDSILSIQVIARSGLEGLRITPRNLFENPTIAQLARVAEKGVAIKAEQGIVEGKVVLTPIQRWFFSQELQNPNHFNQALLLKVNEPLNDGLLRRLVEELLAHHDALRLRFVRKNAQWEQVSLGLEACITGSEHFEKIELGHVPDQDLSETITDWATKIQKSLDIVKGPIFRVVLLDTGENRPDRILIVIHHLAIDGISWRILLEDIQTLYFQISNNSEINLPPKTTSFRQWANKLLEYAQSKEIAIEFSYWNELSSKKIPHLPTDFARGKNIESSQDRVSVSLTEDETKALIKEVPNVYHTEINDVLLTALAQVLRNWTRSNDLLVEMEGHGREDLFEDIDVSRTVGWFTAISPVFLHLIGSESIGDAIKSIKEQIRNIPHHGIGYGLLRYLSQNETVKHALSQIPQPEVSFNYLGQFDQVIPEESIFQMAKESRGPDRDAKGIRSTLLDINGAIMRGKLTLEWSYSMNFHRRQTIERLAQEYIERLRNIIQHCQNPSAEAFTPSDFPLADLDQKDLDKLLKKLNKG